MKVSQHVLDMLEKARLEGRVEGTDEPIPGAALPIEAEPEKQPTEKEFMWKIINRAEELGWKYYHTYLSVRSVAGFPDLLLVRDRVVVAELKKEGENPTQPQREWLHAFQVAGVEVYLWRPGDWPEIERILK